MLHLEAQRAATLALTYAAAGDDLPTPMDQYRRVVRDVLTALETLHYGGTGSITLDAASRNVVDTALAARIDAACDAVHGCRE